MNIAGRLVPADPSARWKLAGLVVAAPAVGVLLLFAVGEMGGGDLSGVQHLVQLTPLLAVLAAAWRWPRAGGRLLIALASLLAAVYAVFALTRSDLSLAVVVVAELLFFAPAILAGLFFIRASRVAPRAGTSRG